jgi:hypothetical protein
MPSSANTGLRPKIATQNKTSKRSFIGLII